MPIKWKVVTWFRPNSASGTENFWVYDDETEAFDKALKVGGIVYSLDAENRIVHLYTQKGHRLTDDEWQALFGRKS